MSFGFAYTGDIPDQLLKGFKKLAVKKANPKVGSNATSKKVVHRSTAPNQGSRRVN